MTVRAERRLGAARRKSVFRRAWESRYMYLLILPGILFFLIFRYIPIYGIQLAFKTFRASLGSPAAPGAGLKISNICFSTRISGLPCATRCSSACIR